MVIRTHEHLNVDSTAAYRPPKNAREAIQLQKQMARLRKTSALPDNIHTVGGADAAFTPDGKWCVAALIVLSYPDLEIIEQTECFDPLAFPYIPGLLSFREAPAVCRAAGRLNTRPDVLLIDGQGKAHPRRFGLAAHVGVLLDWPTIGCAKSRLIGTHRPVGPRKGNQCRLLDQGEIIGKVVRTRDGVKPLYVSEGHLTELDQAVKLVLACCRKYRIAEPVRKAHQAVTKLRRTRPVDK